MSETMNIYLAGPFFDEQNIQRDRANRVAEKLRSNPTVTDVFVPMDSDENTSADFTQALDKQHEWGTMTYNSDIEELSKADCVVAILDFYGHGMDDGTAFEVGYFHALYPNKPIMIYQEGDELANLMLTNAARYYTRDINDLATVDFKNMPKKEYEGALF
ncbi:nucleoside 2-deoxyribosyltransferase [Lentilactobacillus laojiaonis]|uniref:nucleoside 2-deoxyribosyltransferase n=1 Tax=Lentilactobacillus laojiaonis TaxID=2883998 RepID=UPI001D0A2FF0|nr:nucleoside 2-deoxyribosyltransferase [Lentilactobacillus laojiaonis]UDM31983.1 nucleoside 2-deoxyribosyltransferase [Lentilactobacillus laojiaonis]